MREEIESARCTGETFFFSITFTEEVRLEVPEETYIDKVYAQAV
jgi:hypothetical protein